MLRLRGLLHFNNPVMILKYVPIWRSIATAAVSLHSVEHLRWTFRKGSEHFASIYRFICISVNMVSLIHSLTWPLSLPLLSAKILRGFTLEFLPCAFYPMLTHAQAHTHRHTHKHTYLLHTSQQYPRFYKFVYLHLCVCVCLCKGEKLTAIIPQIIFTTVWKHSLWTLNLSSIKAFY